ncbi:MAG: creatininase family protein [Nocardioidaceae bacterium]
MTSAIYNLTSPDVQEALAVEPTVVLPFGSVEQHGPHLPCGTDTMAAELVARTVADRLGGLLAAIGPYGVTPIHAGHPGTISLSRKTFELLAHDVLEELIRMGASVLVLVNWHEGNTASLNAVATDLQERHDVAFIVAQACYVAQRLYADDGGELTHGGGIETLAVMAHNPGLLRLERAGRPSRPPGADELDGMRRSREVYGFITDVTELAGDGWYGNPTWATTERAEVFAETVAGEIVRQVQVVVDARKRGRGARRRDEA